MKFVLKRLFDILVSGFGLLAISPLLGILAALQLWVHGWPVFFVQERPGHHGRLFKMVKFRTMTNARGLDGQLLADAERMTGFGRFLRKTSLDELPELWNVLKGEMSLVGPRPLLVSYLKHYTPHQARRHAMRPGITGLAQVRGRNALSWEERLAIDVEYVDNWNLRIDLRILWQTVGVVVGARGVSAEGQATMSEFQGNGMEA